MGQAARMHIPVLRDRCVALLEPALREPGSLFVDATLGLGGHTEAVLTQCPHAIAIGIDRDPQALQLATERLVRFGDRFTPFEATFDQIDEIQQPVSAVLMDLGVSSLQLDQADRGFAYAQDGPLDMRMNRNEGQSAAELLNTADHGTLTRILRDYGEEKFASKIARRIVDQRQRRPWSTTGQLAQLIDETIPAPARRRGGNPAKRTFQALRIAVNDELGILERTLPKALRSLRIGGRMAVESYHSLEDKAVKRVFSRGLTDTAPAGLPVIPQEDAPRLKALTRGAEKADEEEIARNPRAKSVRLRAVELVRPWEDR